MVRTALLMVALTLCACSSATENTEMQVSGTVANINLSTSSFIILVANVSGGTVIADDSVRVRLADSAIIEVEATTGRGRFGDIQLGRYVDVWLTSAQLASEYPTVVEAWKVFVREAS